MIFPVVSDFKGFDISIWFLQIRFILLQNRQGKTRLAKYYVPLEESEKHKVEYEVFLIPLWILFLSSLIPMSSFQP